MENASKRQRVPETQAECQALKQTLTQLRELCSVVPADQLWNDLTADLSSQRLRQLAEKWLCKQQRLSNALWCRVFSFLNPLPLLAVVEQTCRQWRAVSLGGPYIFAKWRPPLSHRVSLQTLLPRLASVTHLRLHPHSAGVVEWKAMAQHCTRLRKVVLMAGTKKSAPHIVEQVRAFREQRLTSLVVRVPCLGRERKLAEACSKLSALRVLHLPFMSLSNPRWNQLTNGLPKLRALAVQEIDVKAGFSRLLPMRELKKLTLHSVRFTRLSDLAEMQCVPQLQQLHVVSMPRTPHWVAQNTVYKALAPFPELQQVRMDRVDRGLCTAALASLWSSPKLVQASVEWCSELCDDECAIHHVYLDPRVHTTHAGCVYQLHVQRVRDERAVSERLSHLSKFGWHGMLQQQCSVLGRLSSLQVLQVESAEGAWQPDWWTHLRPLQQLQILSILSMAPESLTRLLETVAHLWRLHHVTLGFSPGVDMQWPATTRDEWSEWATTGAGQGRLMRFTVLIEPEVETPWPVGETHLSPTICMVVTVATD